MELVRHRGAVSANGFAKNAFRLWSIQIMKPPKHLPSGLTGSIIKEPLFGTCFCCDEFEQLMFRLSMASDEADMMGLDL